MKRISAAFISIIIAAFLIVPFTVPASAKKPALPPGVTSPSPPAPVFKATKPHTKSNIAANKTKKSNTVSPSTDFAFNSATQTIELYTGSNPVVDIPSTIGGVAVLHIGERAFITLPVTSVTIPNGVKSIDEAAFANCSSLTNISIPDSVTIIDAASFYYCTALENITLPSQLVTIGPSAFQECASLKGIVIPNSVQTLGAYSFYYCLALGELTLSNQLTKIEEGTFENCPIKTIVIPDSVKQIDDAAFFATSAESLTLSKNLEYIGEYAFAYLPSIKNLVIPDKVKHIGGGAFSDCTGLTSVTLSKDLTDIGAFSFYQCTSLKSITIPEKVTTLDDYAFSNDHALKSAIFTGNVPTTFRASAFMYTGEGFTIYYYAEKDGFLTPIFNGYPCYPLYKVNLAATTGGTASISTDRAAAGSTVTVTATPNKTYVVKAVYYTDSAGKHNITNNSFVMPKSSVIVTAEFELSSLTIAFTALVITFFLAALAYVFWFIIRK